MVYWPVNYATMRGQQASQYDKIFRENLEAVIPTLIKDLLGIAVATSEELPDDIQHTKERKPDALKKITDSKGNTFILHLEFQVADEPEMVYRMAEYYVMLIRRYRLPVQQYVLFLGAGQAAMPTVLDSENMQFRFSLISFSAIDYTLFVRSHKPEEIMLGILADFKQVTANDVIKEILSGLNRFATGDLNHKRYIRQLRILSQMRNLASQIDLVMDSIVPFLDEKKDLFYMAGKFQVLEKVIVNLLSKKSFSDEEIADLTEIHIDVIRRVKAKYGLD